VSTKHFRPCYLLTNWFRMELALQVVGLKMTGKIEDAKNVAMRIVGTAGGDGSEPSSSNTTGMMQLASSPSARDLLLARAGETHNFESRIIDLLSVMDTQMGSSAPHSLSIPDAISYPCSSGQTLLHLAVFLGFSSLTRFLVKHGADIDARDRNGCTPLHLAALTQSSDCASALVDAGADLEIVNALGKTPEEIAVTGFFDNIWSRQSEPESERSEDEDADLGDAEEEDDAELRRILSRRVSRRSSRVNLLHSGKATPKRSVDVSRAATPPPPLSDEKSGKSSVDKRVDSDVAEAKRAASFMEKMIQRTLAQIPAPQGIIPNIPQLPLPHLPHLPGVPWGALPQIPMVFPVFVPMVPNWPYFRGGDHAAAAEGKADGEGDDTNRNMGASALRAAQEWRATWEKWVALAVATTARQQVEDLPPPVYTPRVVEDESTKEILAQEAIELHEPVASTSSRPHPDMRPVGYDSTPVPDQVVESFGYQPAKQSQKLQKLQKKRKLFLFHHFMQFNKSLIR